ncbi:MAG: hypothetical protein JSR47_10850 [Proteobacteria bacterium]|nr:hypothetical protein [Pseudomonadota bacterium]MBS0546478.1 hypothetical protein [Pseudomonadota bacterium]
MKKKVPARGAKRVAEPPLEGASSHRSFKGALKEKADAGKPKRRTRHVAPDKGELSPR